MICFGLDGRGDSVNTNGSSVAEAIVCRAAEAIVCRAAVAAAESSSSAAGSICRPARFKNAAAALLSPVPERLLSRGECVTPSRKAAARSAIPGSFFVSFSNGGSTDGGLPFRDAILGLCPFLGADGGASDGGRWFCSEKGNTGGEDCGAICGEFHPVSHSSGGGGGTLVGGDGMAFLPIGLPPMFCACSWEGAALGRPVVGGSFGPIADLGDCVASDNEAAAEGGFGRGPEGGGPTADADFCIGDFFGEPPALGGGGSTGLVFGGGNTVFGGGSTGFVLGGGNPVMGGGSTVVGGLDGGNCAFLVEGGSYGGPPGEGTSFLDSGTGGTGIVGGVISDSPGADVVGGPWSSVDRRPGPCAASRAEETEDSRFSGGCGSG